LKARGFLAFPVHEIFSLCLRAEQKIRNCMSFDCVG